MNGIWGMNAGQLLVAGGPMMIPIVICSMVAVVFVLEKLFYLSGIKTNPNKLKTTVFDLVRDNKLKEALDLCNTNPSPIAKILKAGLLRFGSAREEIKEAIEDASHFEVPKLEKNFTGLTTIAHIAPLLGLLGTVTGLTTCFQMIQAQANSLNPVTPGDLAGGIWEALLTTVAGLMVAIPTFIVYNYLLSRVNVIVLEMERAATELVNFLSHISNQKLPID